jgi:deferrochelatase/peroxidase EfeB
MQLPYSESLNNDPTLLIEPLLDDRSEFGHFNFTNKIVNSRLQEGIKYSEKPFHAPSGSLSSRGSFRNESFAILFLRIRKDSEVVQIIESLKRLWKMYSALRKGIVHDLPDHPVPTGELTILIGYGPNVFKVRGVTKKIPRDFMDRQFLSPRPGRPILDGSGLTYGDEPCENVGTTEDIAIQIISKTQLATYRAIQETWSCIRDSKTARQSLRFSKFFTGFQRDDGRSWLGYHDEVSNMTNAEERLGAIAVNIRNNSLIHRDRWTRNGTYLAFLRIEINLDLWRKIERKKQDLIVGRDKFTGIPLAGVDKFGKPLLVEESRPASGIREFDSKFHDHPDYFIKPTTSKTVQDVLDVMTSSKILSLSHIGRTRHIDRINSTDPTSRRIFRQSYEFLEPVAGDCKKPFRTGLNFVSFQNDPGRLFFILTDPNWLGNTNFGGESHQYGINRLLSLLAGGMFFVPPRENPFPGASIFSQHADI